MPTTRLYLNRIVLPILAVFALQPVASQDLPGIKLRVKDTAVIEGQAFASFMVQIPVKCDAKGNVYFRMHHMTDFYGQPVTKVSREGKLAGEFSIRSAPEFEEGGTYDWVVSPEGEVFLLGAKSVEERHIVKFSPDGEYDSAFLLEPYLEPRHIAVFPSGELLISGGELSPRDREPTGKLLLALYDRRGKFLREISLPRDVENPKEPPAGESESASAAKEGYVLTHSTAVAAEDGNMYLMRATTSPVVYVISPAGAVLRRLVIPPPEQELRVNTMKVAGGRIAIQFLQVDSEGRTEKHIFLMVDAVTGEKFANYLSTPEIGGAWACYTPEGFTFLGSKGKPPRMSLIKTRF